MSLAPHCTVDEPSCGVPKDLAASQAGRRELWGRSIVAYSLLPLARSSARERSGVENPKRRQWRSARPALEAQRTDTNRLDATLECGRIRDGSSARHSGNSQEREAEAGQRTGQSRKWKGGIDSNRDRADRAEATVSGCGIRQQAPAQREEKE